MTRLARALAFGKKFFKRYGKIIIPVFCLSVIGVIIFVDPAIAQDFTDRYTTDSTSVTLTNALTNPIDAVMVLMAALFNGIAAGVGWMIVTLLKVILIPILNYDGFSTSRIIGLGWSLVRDVVNMFVVLILLVIAVLTIVGSPKANWEQQIPRLFIYVIAVNFSRTICGFLLDIGNVIMFQFVNAILDVGAGNFAQLLRLNISGSFSDLNGEATKSFQLLASAYLQLVLLLAILAVIGIMALVFIYRIVVLWVLIIMSPAAFFLGGIKDVLGQAGSAYGEWWKKFSSAIILGPMLTFFLWLALAAASTGDIVSSENFTVGEVETTRGLVLKAFDMSQITGLLIGLVLLVVGMQQAAGAAGALGGVAAKFINEGMGMRIAKGALRLPAQQLGRQADRRLGNPGSTFTKDLGGELVGLGQDMRSKGKLGGLLGGRLLSNVGDRLQRVGQGQLHEAEHNAEARVKEMSEDRLASEVELAAGGESSLLMSNEDNKNFVMKRFVTDKKFRKAVEGKLYKKYKPEEAAERFENIARNAMKTVETHEEDILGTDEATGKSFNSFKTEFVHVMSSMKNKKGIEEDATSRQLAHLRGEKTDLHDLSEAAINSQAIRGHLSSIKRYTEDNKEISKFDDVLAGKAGDKLRLAAEKPPNADRPGEGSRKFEPATRAESLRTLDEKNLRLAVTGGDLSIKNLTENDFSIGGTKLAKAVAMSDRDFTHDDNRIKDAGARVAVGNSLERVISDTNTTSGERRNAMAARYLLSYNPATKTYADRSLNFTGANKGDQVAALGQLLKRDPSLAGNFATGDSETNDAIERAITPTLITKMSNEARDLKKTDQRYKDIAKSVKAIREAMDEIKARNRGPNDKLPDSFTKKKRDIEGLDIVLNS